jgi:hypothetical protein
VAKYPSFGYALPLADQLSLRITPQERKIEYRLHQESKSCLKV